MRSFKREDGRDVHEEKNAQRMNFRLKFRRLHFVNDEDLMWGAYNGTSHKIRHKKKLRKFNERLSDKYHFNESEAFRARSQNLSKHILDFGLAGNHSLIFKNMENRVNYSEDIVREKIDIHEHCYSTNEVLEIIAVTCLVNFIFWFAIITCVSFLTKKEKAKYESWDSIESVEIPSDDEIRFQHDKNHYPCCLRRPISGSDYVDGGFGNDYLTMEEEVALVKKIDGRYGYSGNGCFEDDGLDWGILHDEGLELNNWKNRRKSLLPTSYSMENLIF